MDIPPQYSVDQKILELISQIEVLRLYFSSINISPEIKTKIQRVSILKSSLFSARIEGNSLLLSDLDNRDTEKQKKLEVFNIKDAINLIEGGKEKLVTKKMILKLHGRVLNNLSLNAGYFRKEPSAIFNSAGIAVYLPPSPSKFPKLLDKLLDYINSPLEKFPLITALIAHLVFEKIHPFLDGNGRVGRLLISLVLKVKDWNFQFSIPFEEYLDIHKEQYYYHLDNGLLETNSYLVFMLEAIFFELKDLKKKIDEEVEGEGFFLPPRQDEIAKIIKDHKILSFDGIRRRFLKVPERTLRYDLEKLVKKGIIEKTGETRGRYYRTKKLI